MYGGTEMKRLISLCAATALLISLGGCADFAPDPTPTQDTSPGFEYTAENFPALYASAAYTPMAEAVAAIMLGTTREEAAAELSLVSTDGAWAALDSGEAGLVIAPEGSDMPGGIETAAIGRDALVFFVGQGSGIDSLAVGELERIFSLRADSWAPYGGEGAISILKRPAGSGSAAAIERLIGSDPAGYTGESAPLSHEGVIGYGLWSECALMGLADGYRLIAVGGVEPTEESISSGEYPLCVDTLAGVAADAAEESPEQVLYLWLQGTVGQAFLSSQGYWEAEE